MCWHFRQRRDGWVSAGQASVEAALIIPLLLVGMLLAVQPAIVLYDRLVMESAVSEGCRVAETSSSGEGVVREYVERRLAAIPSIEAFHAGAWTIEVTGADQQSEYVSVRVSHDLKPLPLMAAGLRLVGFAGSDGMYRQEAFREMRSHDGWALRSEFGLDFGAWAKRGDEKA